jgi:hypothetical protein
MIGAKILPISNITNTNLNRYTLLQLDSECIVNIQKTIGKACSFLGSVKSFTAEPILSDHAQWTWFSVLPINALFIEQQKTAVI